MKSLFVGAVSAAVLVATAGYASAQEPPPPMEVQTGPDAEVTVDGLHRVDNALMALAYVKPDMNLQGYTRFMLDPPIRRGCVLRREIYLSINPHQLSL